MAQQINLYTWATGVQGFGLEDGLTGLGGKGIRVNAGGTGLEYADFSSITAVNATTPLAVSGTTTRTISIAGLSGFGSANQVVVNLGTVWGYQSTTGTGNIVREGSPTITGTLTASAITSASGAITFGAVSGTAFRLVMANASGTLSTLGIGSAGQSVRLNSGATNWEYYTPDTGDLTAVTGTSPIIVTSGTGPIPNVTLAGLTSIGTGGQVPISNGTVWQYVSSTGTGNNVRATSPTFTGTVTGAVSTWSGGLTVTSTDGITSTTGPIYANGTSRIGSWGVGSLGATDYEFISMIHNGSAGRIDVLAGGTGSYRPFQVATSGTVQLEIAIGGGITATSLAGSGTRVVLASSAGLLSSVATTGTGNVVLASGPTISTLTVNGTAFAMNASTMGMFSATPVSQRSLTEYTETAFANPVTQTSTFNGQMTNVLTWMQQIQAGLGNNAGYGVFDLV